MALHYKGVKGRQFQCCDRNTISEEIKCGVRVCQKQFWDSELQASIEMSARNRRSTSVNQLGDEYDKTYVHSNICTLRLASIFFGSCGSGNAAVEVGRLPSRQTQNEMFQWQYLEFNGVRVKKQRSNNLTCRMLRVPSNTRNH